MVNLYPNGLSIEFQPLAMLTVQSYISVVGLLVVGPSFPVVGPLPTVAPPASSPRTSTQGELPPHL